MSDPHPQPLAPPTQPGAIVAPPRPSNWPNVIGIIAIVLGAGGILGGVWGAASPWLMSSLSWAMLPGQAESLQAWLPWTVSSSLAAAAVAILLLLGGIKLVKRNPAAPGLLRVWAILKLPMAVCLTIVGIIVQREQFDVVQGSTTAMPMGSAFFDALTVFGVVVSVVWYGALPVFMLIWFARKKSKAEVAGWS